MRGLGSRSCGPDPEEKYELRPHKFSLAFAIRDCGFEEAVSSARLDFGKKTEALSGTYTYEKPKKMTQVADCDL